MVSSLFSAFQETDLLLIPLPGVSPLGGKYQRKDRKAKEISNNQQGISNIEERTEGRGQMTEDRIKNLELRV